MPSCVEKKEAEGVLNATPLILRGYVQIKSYQISSDRPGILLVEKYALSLIASSSTMK